MVKSFENLDVSFGEITIAGNDLTPGMYLYSLFVDGNEIDTKRMILTQ